MTYLLELPGVVADLDLAMMNELLEGLVSRGAAGAGSAPESDPGKDRLEPHPAETDTRTEEKETAHV